jgi:hypothetical protein
MCPASRDEYPREQRTTASLTPSPWGSANRRSVREHLGLTGKDGTSAGPIQTCKTLARIHRRTWPDPQFRADRQDDCPLGSPGVSPRELRLLFGKAVRRRTAGCRRASSRGITEEGCEIITESGAVLLSEIDGPPFEAGVAAVLGFVVLGLVLTAVTIRSRGVPMRRVVLGCVILYLALGAVFAWNYMPQQMWTCPDPGAPHGTITFGQEPRRDDCHPTETIGDRASWFAFAVPSWLPLVVLKGLSNMAGP